MDDFTRHINEMNDCLQSFNKNNRILSDNWKDDQADRFTQSVLTKMTEASQGFIQGMENDKNGIGAIIKQMEDMEKEIKHLEAGWPTP